MKPLLPLLLLLTALSPAVVAQGRLVRVPDDRTRYFPCGGPNFDRVSASNRARVRDAYERRLGPLYEQRHLVVERKKADDAAAAERRRAVPDTGGSARALDKRAEGRARLQRFLRAMEEVARLIELEEANFVASVPAQDRQAVGRALVPKICSVAN